MYNTVENNILKQGVNELYNRGKLSSDNLTEMNTYINNITNLSSIKIEYKDFNKIISGPISDLLFDDSNREVVWVSNTPILYTNNINIKGYLKCINVIATDKHNLEIKISKNNSDWYIIDDFDNIDEYVEQLYISIKITSTNTIKGIFIIYGVC